eukprot:m.695484 g.695484  ORF g.695484 m.695484 type:complete len:193 (+) comp22888_c1_seq39:687-1265(+)
MMNVTAIDLCPAQDTSVVQADFLGMEVLQTAGQENPDSNSAKKNADATQHASHGICTYGLGGITQTNPPDTMDNTTETTGNAPQSTVKSIMTDSMLPASGNSDEQTTERIPVKISATGVCASSYDGVVFCLLLSYMPTPEQRYAACEKAHRILRDGVRLMKSLLICQTTNSPLLRLWCSCVAQWDMWVRDAV